MNLKVVFLVVLAVFSVVNTTIAIAFHTPTFNINFEVFDERESLQYADPDPPQYQEPIDNPFGP